MSLSFGGHDDHGHGTKSASSLVRLLIGLFLFIWIGNAVVYEMTGTHRPPQGYEDVTVSKAVKYVIDPLYRSLQLFHFHDSHWEGHRSPLSYVSRFLAAAYALGLPLVLVAWFVKGGFLRLIHWISRKDFVVVVGAGEFADQLVSDLITNGRTVLYLAPEDSHDHHPAGAIMLKGDFSSGDFWRRVVRVHRASAVVFMADDDATNIRWSVMVENSLQAGDRSEPLVCHLHLGDLHLKKGLMSLLPALDNKTLIERRYFSRYEISARLLARRYPLPSTLVDKESFPEHYVIIGFGQLGQNVALKLVKMGQQVLLPDAAAGRPHYEARHPRVTVVDKRGDEAAAAFLRSYPGFADTCQFQIRKLDCSEPGFLDLSFLAGLDPAERCSLIFCLEDETLVVSTVLMMLDVCRAPENDINGIYLRAMQENGPCDLLNRQQASLSKSIPIITFAADHEIWNEDVVLGLSLDLMAERIHRTYCENFAKLPPEPGNPAPAAQMEWLALSADERDGNREPADHLWAKLRTLGYELESVPIGHAEPDEALNAEIERQIEDLASSEHYRWMAWRLIGGWRYGKERDKEAKIHPDIVGYHELTELGREKDRVIVRLIPELLKQGRLRARKVKPDAGV